MKQRFFFMIITLLICCFAGSGIAADPSKVLILPFTIHAEKDLSFLKDGISDMLSTRLARDEMSVLSREETLKASGQISGAVTEKLAVSVAEKFSTDYVAYGSVTVLGDTISTDAKFYDLKKKKNIVIFHQTGKNTGDVISHINLFAAQINTALFPPEMPTPAASAKPAAKPEKSEDESRRNPESLWNERGMGVNKPVQPIKPTSGESAVIPATPPPGHAEEMWKSPTYQTEIRSMSVGDTDGDGKNEIVFVSEKDVFIYRYTNGVFAKVREIKGSVGDTILGVDVADINGNGKAEIFVTVLNQSNDILSSYVLESDGTRFNKIAERQKWYYKVIDVSGKGKLLMGQKRGMKDIFMAGIYQLRWDGREYVSFREQGMPSEVNVFGFAYGDVSDTGREMTMAFTQNELLRLLDKDGKEEWRSIEPYGGSAVYLEYKGDFSGRIGNTTEKNHYYLPQRILIRDIDKDKKTEVIVARNTDTTNRVFSRFRMFKSGYIACLTWDNISMSEKWKTKEISGHITDYVLADINNDGKDDLVFSVVARVGSAFGDAKSFIVVQKLP
ncbi:MAG TPA: hypothetical protein DCQ37_20755 [Desulfobacteraceae bacterium]|nr:hypothetical protein [Desulfobacteraceae bacterium]